MTPLTMLASFDGMDPITLFDLRFLSLLSALFSALLLLKEINSLCAMLSLFFLSFLSFFFSSLFLGGLSKID